MQTLSSASRTCMASASAVECTATVAMPSSLQARNTRNAISPRLAMRIFSNIESERLSFLSRPMARAGQSLDDHQRLAVFDRLSILDEDLRDAPGPRRGNLVHGLHRFDDQHRLAGTDLAADLDIGARSRLRCEIGGADHRRGHGARMFREIVAGGRVGSA